MDLIDENGKDVNAGTLLDNGVDHEDVIYMRPKCPSDKALVVCPKLKSKQCGSKKNKKMCTKCGKKCFPGKSDLVCKIPSLYAKCSPDAFRIHVIDLEGKKHTYDVLPTDKISAIKAKVSKDTGLPASQINLKDIDDKELKKGTKDLKSESVENEDTLFMYFNVHVIDPDGVKHTFSVSPNDDVDELKRDIESKTGIAPELQKLKNDDDKGVNKGR